jgi:outer membrane protein assembly complex protein YaeT
MRSALARLALAVLLAASGRAAAAQVRPDLLGRTVEWIAYTCDGPADALEIGSLVAFRLGFPLTEEDTGATIQNLFATLDFSEILVVASPRPEGGVAVTIHLWRSYRVAGIEFDGRSALSREDMHRAVALQERGPFNATALAEGASALERRLAAEGYIGAAVDPEVTFDPATFTAQVVYRIAAGERAATAPPFFDGPIEPFTADALVAKMKLKIGKPYQEARAQTDTERLRKFLLEQGHFKASVELIASEPTDEGTVRPVYRIAVGPRFAIEATGIKEKRVRSELLALLDAQGFDEDLLEQWADARREGLQKSGHYRAKVEAKASGMDPVVVRVAVDAGAKYAVERIAFAGNGSVSDETLRELIVTREKGLPLLQNGYLLDGELQRDADAVLGYYQTRGWIDARVGKPAVTPDARPDRLDVAFTILEGPRTFVASRQVEGAEHLTAAEVDALLSVRAGEPFNPSAVRQDAAALTTRYWNTGWREAAVRDRRTLSPDKTKVDVVFMVDEGMRTFFGKTIIRGNAVTKPERILRQVSWKEGDPYSEEKIADTQRNLARTGVFRSIDVRPQPASPDNQEHTVDIDLTEARRLSLLYGVGYQYASGASNPNDPFATAGISYRNLFGRMQSVALEVQYAPVSGRGYVVANFLEPYLFNTDIPLTVATFASREPIQDIEVERLGVFFESVKLFGRLRVGLRYSYQYIAPKNPEDLSTIVIEKYPLSARPIKQSAVGPSLFYDRRDDVLDPHKGYYLTVAGNYAFPFLDADAWYGKVSGQAAYFWSIPGGILAASGRVGAIYPHAITSRGDTVPIAEKFFVGGSSTGRGFATNLGGIPGSTVDYNTQATYQPSGNGNCAQAYPTAPDANLYDCSPGPRIIGGNGFMAFGLEYRFPIAGNLGVSVFYDLAQVWSNAGQIHFAIDTSDTATQGATAVTLPASTGLRQSVGFGIHYMTPIGPLRLEVGRPMPAQTIAFDVTRTVNPFGVPCPDLPPVPDDCKPLARGSVKQKERIFLSIGYPF